MEPGEQPKKISRLHQVTPLSKYFAMIIFVLLPFVGGYVGYKNAPEKVIEVEKTVVQYVEVEKEIEQQKIEQPEIECFYSKDYVVISPVWGSGLSSILVKDKLNHDQTIDCEYIVEEEDMTLERGLVDSVFILANNRIYIDSGTSKLRGLAVYDIEMEQIVLTDSYMLGDIETSADFVRYWSVADSEMSSNDCSDIDLEEWGNWGVGLNEYVEFNFETGEETVLEKACVRRE